MSTLAERQAYQRTERAFLEAQGVALPGDDRTCWQCGCSDSLACGVGCSWVEVDLCSLCADEGAP